MLRARSHLTLRPRGWTTLSKCEPEQALIALRGFLSGVAHSDKIRHSLPSTRTDLRYHKSKREPSGKGEHPPEGY